MSSTAPDQTFQKLLEELQEQCELISKSTQGTGEQRKWMLPPGEDDIDVLDIDKFVDLFNRDKLNEDYEDALHNEGTTAVCMAAKVQIDYTSMMGRAFVGRHTTSARAAMHAANRRLGHSDDGGIFIGHILQYVQDILATG